MLSSSVKLFYKNHFWFQFICSAMCPEKISIIPAILIFVFLRLMFSANSTRRIHCLCCYTFCWGPSKCAPCAVILILYYNLPHDNKSDKYRTGLRLNGCIFQPCMQQTLQIYVLLYFLFNCLLFTFYMGKFTIDYIVKIPLRPCKAFCMVWSARPVMWYQNTKHLFIFSLDWCRRVHPCKSMLTPREGVGDL